MGILAFIEATARGWLADLSARWSALSPWTRVRLKARSRGALGSVLIHVLIVLGLMSAGLARPLGLARTSAGGGQPNLVEGRALTVTLTSLDPQSAPEAPKSAPTSAPPPGGSSAAARQQSAANTDLTAEPSKDPGETTPSARPDHAASAAAASGAASLPVDVQAGQPHGSEDLLRQIARCLPSSLRPNIPFARLVLVLGKDGALRAAPQIDVSVPFASRDTVRDADRVVQAALQCGPYRMSSGAPQHVSVVPDFSFLTPQARVETP
jgi:hypothetical protein